MFPGVKSFSNAEILVVQLVGLLAADREIIADQIQLFPIVTELPRPSGGNFFSIFHGAFELPIPFVRGLFPGDTMKDRAAVEHDERLNLLGGCIVGAYFFEDARARLPMICPFQGELSHHENSN